MEFSFLISFIIENTNIFTFIAQMTIRIILAGVGFEPTS